MDISLLVDDIFNFEAKSNERMGGFIFTNSTVSAGDLVKTGPGHFNVLKGGRNYHIEVLELSADSKQVELRVNGTYHKVLLSTPADRLLLKTGIDPKARAKVNSLRAPMPGLVLRLQVKEDDIAEKGQTLLVLEAMKMENSIGAAESVKIKQLLVGPGDKVEKNQILMLFYDA